MKAVHPPQSLEVRRSIHRPTQTVAPPRDGSVAMHHCGGQPTAARQRSSNRACVHADAVSPPRSCLHNAVVLWRSPNRPFCIRACVFLAGRTSECCYQAFVVGDCELSCIVCCFVRSAGPACQAELGLRALANGGDLSYLPYRPYNPPNSTYVA